MRRFREAYIGAVFTFFGRKYRVHSHEVDAVVLTDVDARLKTEASFFSVVSTKSIFDGYGCDGFEIYYGALDVVMNFAGYSLVAEGSDAPIEHGGGGEAHFQNNLHAFWISTPRHDDALAGIGALEHLVRVGAMFVIPADRFDASTHSRAKEEPTASYYENGVTSNGSPTGRRSGFHLCPIGSPVAGIELSGRCSSSRIRPSARRSTA